MKWKLLTPVFTEFQRIFQDTMKELFVNKCLCEEASLYFFVIEILKNSKCVYFVNEEGKIENVPINGEQTFDESIHKFMSGKFDDRKYMKVESDSFLLDDQAAKVFWIFSSECMNLNRGRFLFRCVCEALSHYFNGMLNQISSVDQLRMINQAISRWTGSEHYLIQRSLQAAASKTCLYLQKLYAPLNLPSIEELSGEYYERAECQSNMVFLFHETVSRMKETDFQYSFENAHFDEMELEEIEFIPKQNRLIRKLLQIAQQDMYLVMGEDVERQTFRALGICKESFFQDTNQQFPYVQIRFRNHMQWDLLVNETYIFSYRNGQYKIEDEIHRETLVKKIQEYFGTYVADYDNAAASIMHALQQEHGTMLILMNEKDAHKEVKRLGEKQYGLPVASPGIQTKDISQLSNIDGSVILDTSGRIHGIGMILDGTGLAHGSLARGARYNSAVKYRKYLKKRNIKAMIFIISEDRTVDILLSD